MNHALLRLENLSKRFGGLLATDSLSLELQKGETHAVIGPNGAGKTTLVALISGLLAPDRGTIVFDGEDITARSAEARSMAGMARTFQITRVFRDFTVFENTLLAAQSRAGHSFRFWSRVRRISVLRSAAMEVLDQLGLADRYDVPAGQLSHGEQRVLEIALALATRPKLMLLDEPMAGMGPEDSERMKVLLAGLHGQYTMLLIEHDMDAVFRLSDRITVLVYGRVIATGLPAEIRNHQEVRRAYLGDGAKR
jgi:branched-chain amino acid transport system ATP-binding protein